MNSSNSAFGQSSNSIFEHPSFFGQNNNSNNSLFAEKPFSGISTGVFKASPPVLNAPSAPPAFGVSSSPSLGDSSSSSHGTSVYGHNIVSGGSFSQSQPAFESTNSSPFGSSSQSAFAIRTPSLLTPASGAASTQAFGSTSNPLCTVAVSTPASGATGSSFSFGSTSASVTSPFGCTITGGFPISSFVGQTTPEGKVVSISATPEYKEKSHEELRWEYYYYLNFLGSRGAVCNCCEKHLNMNNTTQHTNPSAYSSPAFGRPSNYPFVTNTSIFSAPTSTPLWSTPSAAPSVFKSTPFPFHPSDPLFGTQAKGTTSASGFPDTAAQFSDTVDFKMNNTQQTNPFASSSPASGQSSANPFSFTISTNPFDPNATSTFGTPGFGSSTSSLGSSPSTLVLVFNFKNMHLT